MAMEQVRKGLTTAVEVQELLIRNTANAQDQASDLAALSNRLSDGWEVKGYSVGLPPGHRYVLLTRE